MASLYILTFFLVFSLTFYLAFFPALYLASILTFSLAFYLAFCLAFSPVCSGPRAQLPPVQTSPATSRSHMARKDKADIRRRWRQEGAGESARGRGEDEGGEEEGKEEDWLVVSNIFFIFHFIYGIIPTPLTHIFQRDRSTTNQLLRSRDTHPVGGKTDFTGGLMKNSGSFPANIWFLLVYSNMCIPICGKVLPMNIANSYHEQNMLQKNVAEKAGVAVWCLQMRPSNPAAGLIVIII